MHLNKIYDLQITKFGKAEIDSEYLMKCVSDAFWYAHHDPWVIFIRLQLAAEELMPNFR